MSRRMHCTRLFFAADDMLEVASCCIWRNLALAPSVRIFPSLNLQSPPSGGVVAIMGRSMVETVSIILSAEEGQGEGRVVLAKPTIQTDIEHFFLLLLCKVAKASILDAFTPCSFQPWK